MFSLFKRPEPVIDPPVDGGDMVMPAARPELPSSADRADRRGLMAALDVAQCLMWFDGQGRVLETNQNTQDLLSLGAEVLQSMTYQDLAGDPGQHGNYFAKHWGRIASGALRVEERELVGANCRVWASISYAAIQRQDGQTRRVFALIIDLSPWSAKPKGVFARLG